MINRWFEDGKEVLTNPTGFFEDAETDGFGYPLKFAVISLLIAGVLNALRSVVFSTVLDQGAGFALAGAIGGLVGTVVIGLIGLLISAAVIHLFVLLFDGEGYAQTLAVLEYASVITVITAALSFIPILGQLAALLVGLYGLYIEIKGLEIFQDLTTGKAALAVILPGVILAIIVIAFAILIMGAAFLTGIGPA